MSNTNFTCIPNRIFDNGMLYSPAELKLRGLMRLPPKDELDIYLALPGPVTFLPDAYRRSKADNFAAFMQGRDPHSVLCSGLVHRIRRVAPHATLTVWCNEDTPHEPLPQLHEGPPAKNQHPKAARKCRFFG
jgi:hypothetical protein